MSDPGLQSIEYGGASDVGPVRSDNQDTIWPLAGASPAERPLGTLALYGIADGMGGYANGQLASSMALDVLHKTIQEDLFRPPLKALRRGAEMANFSVFQEAQRLNAGRMGTTLTAGVIASGMLSLVHVGDSRAYLIRDGHAKCLTSDHTAVGDLVRMRVVPPDRVRTHAQRSVLTRCIGLSMFVQPELIEIPLQVGDRLVFCSDGVWSVIEDDEFGRVSTQAEDMPAFSRRLIDLAMERGTDDNVSAVAVHVHVINQPMGKKNGEPHGLARLFRRAVQP
jgi:PPM family protein phosphatase